MRKMKALLSLLMVFTFIFLAACSGGGADTPAAAPETTPETNTEASGGNDTEPAAETDTENTEEAVAEDVPDLGGRVIKLSAWWDLTPTDTDAQGKALVEQLKKTEEKYNVKFEFVNIPYEEYMEKFTASVLAGEPLADITYLEYKAALPAIQKGQLHKISEFTTPESSINTDQRLANAGPALLGEQYGFYGGMPSNGGVGIHYNRDLFEELGLPDLQELYDKGEWTWDKMLEIAKQATKDTNNDGKMDTWGFSGWSAQVGRNLIVANGGNTVLDPAGDETKATEGLTDPRTIEAIEYLASLYNNNVVKVKSGDKTLWEETDTFKDGDIAMFHAAQWQIGDINFEIGVVPYPIGPQGNPEVTYGDTALNAYFIPKGVKDPALVYQIFEELYDVPQLEEYPSQNYLESLYSYEDDIRIIRENITGTGLVSLDEAYPEYPYYSFVADVLVENASVASAAEKYKQQAQASIDKLEAQNK
ncbi:ABC transporter substrate-binding protein [Paenibacillus sp. FSL H7-0326]|uniref:ABC transporter substrate-binding protein n=1 Tax=Paenibacillus sp. FSL H7-0326 TaxID=1921144 RepID=UPI00096D9BC1|nr:extracellular solute-binding protein [Paenibacillus sp. FSL H7-0326]OMC70869.1 ABC transporter substrate-binding protein [Paenibacillus sp. FSL H7-0326]